MSIVFLKRNTRAIVSLMFVSNYQDRKTQEWKPTTKGISIMPNNVEDIIECILKAMEVMGFTKENRE